MDDSGRIGHDETIDDKQRHFHHATLFYNGEDGFLDGTLPFIAEAIVEEDVIEAARHSHPFLAQDGATRICDTYQHSHRVDPFAGSLAAPRGDSREFKFTNDRLGTLREFVAHAAADASLGPARTEDLVLAINELATNSLRHGGGGGTLRIWSETSALLCEVQDKGHITEPLVGRVPPHPSQHTGRGLWVVNHLCDLVQIRSSPGSCVVRVHMRLPETLRVI